MPHYDEHSDAADDIRELTREFRGQHAQDRNEAEVEATQPMVVEATH